jgi:hypothetical protein
MTVLALLGAAPAMADGPSFYGLLRARDLTPFGYLRLDMKPGYVGSLEPGTWGVDSEIAYQNTWATSPEVERYLNHLPGRRTLGRAAGSRGSVSTQVTSLPEPGLLDMKRTIGSSWPM